MNHPRSVMRLFFTNFTFQRSIRHPFEHGFPTFFIFFATQKRDFLDFHKTIDLPQSVLSKNILTHGKENV
ncbi:MAG: hypothetical protein C4527_24610 [Candidatus Omnitrophota bacterium]|nr:MAG: hypothetical protein C4527_24610 [Candidatus Omnitrophota bacterium]